MELDVYDRPLERFGGRGARWLLRSYSRVDGEGAEVVRVDDVAQLAEALALAEKSSRKVTFRASGLSMHDQSLNDDMIISVERLSTIDVDAASGTVTVGAGAKWGDVVTETLKAGMVPRVVPTSRHITCGGSLMTDGISRYSPSLGSESAHVRRLELLTVGASEPRWIERPQGSSDESADAELFRAVIGSFGYLGVVTRITYDLMRVDEVGDEEDEEKRLKVATRLWAFDTFKGLVDHQLRVLDKPRMDDLEKWDFPPDADPVEYPSVYAVAVFEKGDGRGAVYKSTYARGVEGEPYVIYRPRAWWRPLLGLLLTWRWCKWLVNWVVWRSMKQDGSDPDRPKNDKVFVNEVADYMFFMDGDLATKIRFEDPPSRLLYVIQQTFVVPMEETEDFLLEMTKAFTDAGVEPTLFEFLFMPCDRILMSASYDMPGFAITVAFQDIPKQSHRDEVIAVLKTISRACQEVGGRLHLTKNVYVDDEVIRAMYADRAAKFLRLKDELDPSGVLRNRFFDRVFPKMDGSG